MKHVMFGCVCAILLVLVLSISMTVSGRNARQGELENSLSAAAEHTIEALLVKKAYTIENKEEFVADFIQGMLAQVKNDAKVTVKVLHADPNKGLLSVVVEESFHHPNGKEGKIFCEKTVVLEDYEIPEKPEYGICYLLDGKPYREYRLKEGSPVIIPPPPSKEGKHFQGWREAGGTAIELTGLTVTKDMVLEAVFGSQEGGNE